MPLIIKLSNYRETFAYNLNHTNSYPFSADCIPNRMVRPFRKLKTTSDGEIIYGVLPSVQSPFLCYYYQE